MTELEQLKKAVNSALVDIEAMKGFTDGTYDLTSTDGDTVTIEWPNLDWHEKKLKELINK